MPLPAVLVSCSFAAKHKRKAEQGRRTSTQPEAEGKTDAKAFEAEDKEQTF